MIDDEATESTKWEELIEKSDPEDVSDEIGQKEIQDWLKIFEQDSAEEKKKRVKQHEEIKSKIESQWNKIFSAWKRIRENTILLKALEKRGEEQKGWLKAARDFFKKKEKDADEIKKAKKRGRPPKTVVRQNSLLTGKDKESALKELEDKVVKEKKKENTAEADEPSPGTPSVSDSEKESDDDKKDKDKDKEDDKTDNSAEAEEEKPPKNSDDDSDDDEKLKKEKAKKEKKDEKKEKEQKGSLKLKPKRPREPEKTPEKKSEKKPKTEKKEEKFNRDKKGRIVKEEMTRSDDDHKIGCRGCGASFKSKQGQHFRTCKLIPHAEKEDKENLESWVFQFNKKKRNYNSDSDGEDIEKL